uniref:IRG-type G domain-containing protein n=1 Tax=Labrus bergylta TaxID=56723 RepID=A0A3Q3GL22_9LABR
MGNPFDSEQVHKEIKEALLKNDQALAVAKINEYFDQQKNVPLNIAITGESGSGKSTFVNAFRGIDNRDEKAAPTGTTETTMEVNPYPHPNHPNVTFWDLPGIGTTKFPADKYMKHVGFEKFDFFIIVSSDRFKENDVRLAKEIQRMEKKFYFVRSKIDNSMRDEERTQRDFNKERSLKKIKDNCIQCLQEQGLKSPQVFLVSSFDLQLYDFHLLEETLERELPEHKRDAFLFAMPNISREIINKKKKALHSKIKYFATLSSAVAGVLIPGLSIAVDIGLLVGVVKQYVYKFGLDIKSLQSLANRAGVPLKELKEATISPLTATQVTPPIVMKVFAQMDCSLKLTCQTENHPAFSARGCQRSDYSDFITSLLLQFSRGTMGNQSGRQQIDTKIKEALEKNDQNLARAKIQEYLDKEQNVPLNIAVTGETGSGKSSFVNAIRGIDNKDEKAALTGCVETTMEVKPYPHPNYPKVIFWDLPGIGSTKYPAAEYLKKVGFEKFDFFIIISYDRFRENDVKLAKEIQKMEKKFYFVRSKIDHNISDEKRSQRDFNEERTLTQIRNNCLQDQGLQSPQVFLVSSFHLTLYDFPLLVETLKEELPELQKDAFLLAMPNISLDMIKEKKKAFQAKVKYWATLSAIGAAVPVPGVSVAVDTALLGGVIKQYGFGFGLDIPSLKRMAKYSGVSYEELSKVLKSPLATVNQTPELLLKFIPIIGIPAAMGLSFTFTYRSLNFSSTCSLTMQRGYLLGSAVEHLMLILLKK